MARVRRAGRAGGVGRAGTTTTTSITITITTTSTSSSSSTKAGAIAGTRASTTKIAGVDRRKDIL